MEIEDEVVIEEPEDQTDEDTLDIEESPDGVELDIEDSEDVEIEAPESEDSEEEEVQPKEEKPKRKMSRAQKRITRLIEDKKALEDKVNNLESKFTHLSQAEQNRSKKETETEQDYKLQEIMQKQKAAFEEGNYEDVTKYNLELMQLNQTAPKPVDDLDTSQKKTEYFKSKNTWYNNESSDPGQRKTRFARDLSVELMNDSKYQGWSTSQILDEVSSITNKHFKTNPLRSQSPTEGASNIPANKSKRITISRADYEEAKKIWPHLKNNPAELNKQIIETLK